MARLSVKVSTVLLIGITTLLLMELGCRIYFESSYGGFPWANTDGLWRVYWWKRHRVEDKSGLFSPVEIFDRTLGWTNRPLFRNSTSIDGAERVSTNSLGARNTKDYGYERTDTRRIVVIGDSFAFGQEVNDDETYAARLEQLLPNTEVINLGTIGYGTDQMLLKLRAEGLRYKPDMVIVGVISDDAERNLVSFRDFAKPMFVLNKRGGLDLVGIPVAPPESYLTWEPWRPKLLVAIEGIYASLSSRTAAHWHRVFGTTAALWKQIALEAAQAKASTLFVFGPAGLEIKVEPKRERLDGKPRSIVDSERFFVQSCDVEKLACLNLGPLFRRKVRQLGRLTSRGGHWNAEGHALVAEALAERLSRSCEQP